MILDDPKHPSSKSHKKQLTRYGYGPDTFDIVLAQEDCKSIGELREKMIDQLQQCSPVPSSSVELSLSAVSFKPYDPYEDKYLRAKHVREKFRTKTEDVSDKHSLGSQLLKEAEDKRAANPLEGLNEEQLLFREYP